MKSRARTTSYPLLWYRANYTCRWPFILGNAHCITPLWKLFSDTFKALTRTPVPAIILCCYAEWIFLGTKNKNNTWRNFQNERAFCYLLSSNWADAVRKYVQKRQQSQRTFILLKSITTFKILWVMYSRILNSTLDKLFHEKHNEVLERHKIMHYFWKKWSDASLTVTAIANDGTK